MPTTYLALPWESQETQATMRQPIDDLDLIRRMQAGDDDAVRDMYALYSQRLYTYALRLTNNPATAEDVTQNTLLSPPSAHSLPESCWLLSGAALFCPIFASLNQLISFELVVIISISRPPKGTFLLWANTIPTCISR